MTSALPSGRWSRRTFLLASAGAIGSLGPLGLTACSVPGGPVSPQGSGSDPGAPSAEDPTGGGTPRPAEPSVAIFPGSVEAAAVEDSLAAHAATALGVGSADLGKAGRHLLAAIRDQHLAHAAALRTTDPTDPNSAGPSGSGSTPPPSPSTNHSAKKPGFAKAVAQLLAAESKAAVAHRARALTTEGLTSLLWGSMAVSATHLAAILRGADLAGDNPDPTVATVAPPRARAPMPLVPVVEAEQELVRQLHAIVYGYQLALGPVAEPQGRGAGRRRRVRTQHHPAHRDQRGQADPPDGDRAGPVRRPLAGRGHRPGRADRGPGSGRSDPRSGAPVGLLAAGLAGLDAGLTHPLAGAAPAAWV